MVTDFPVAGLADGVYSVRVTAARPVVVGARASVVGDPSASTTPQDVTGGRSSGSAGTDTSTPGGTSTGTDAGLLDVGGPVDTSGSSSATAATPGATPTSSARGIDLAWIPAGAPLGRTAAVAVAAAPSPMLTLANPTSAPVTVRVARRSGTSSVAVPANGTASIAVSAGVLTLTGAGEVRAAVSYAGTGAIAGYPAVPADQAAMPVRISH